MRIRIRTSDQWIRIRIQEAHRRIRIRNTGQGVKGEKAVMMHVGADRAGQDGSDECGVWRGRHPRQSLQQLR